MVWKDAIRQGGTVNKPRFQRELHPEIMTIEALESRQKKQIDICLPHYQEICWMRNLMDTDFKTPPPDTLLIFTEYAASMALRAIEKVNSSVNAHAVNDNFVCISNRRKAIYTKKRKDDNGDVSEHGLQYDTGQYDQ